MKIRILVLYPYGQGYYPQHEVFGLLNGSDITFVSPSREFEKTARTSGMQFLVARYVSLPAHFSVGVVEHAAISDLDQLIDSVDPDVVVTYELGSAVSYQISRRRPKGRFRQIVLCDATSSAAKSASNWFPTTALFAAVTKRTLDMAIAHTQASSRAIRSAGVHHDRIRTIPPGIFIPDSRPWSPRSPSTPFHVVYLGALRENKGVRQLIRAVKELGRAGISLRLTVAGGGPLLNYLRSNEFGGLVRCVGRISEDEKNTLLSQADLFVYPSIDVRAGPFYRWQEQTAISAIEAMQRGIPTIGSDSGALPEILGRTDAIVQQGSIASLARVMRRAILDADWRIALSRDQFEHARSDYNIYDSARTMEKILSEVVTRNVGPPDRGRPHHDLH